MQILLVISILLVTAWVMNASDPPGFNSAKYVLLIGCDGFGGMYLENATNMLPTFAALITYGASSMRMRDQMPSVSAPNWATIITGMDPELTGIPDNDWVPSWTNPPNPIIEQLPPITGPGVIPTTMWHVAQSQRPEMTIAASLSWDWINYLTEPNMLVFRGNGSDDNVTQAMIQFILNDQPELMFIHFDDIDAAGHASYWGSTEYYDAAQRVDGYIQELLIALDTANMLDSTLIMVTADHGGYRDDHGLFDECNMYVPAIFSGPGVMNSNLTDVMLTNRDFAPTALNALGLQPTQYMLGRIVQQIYVKSTSG